MKIQGYKQTAWGFPVWAQIFPGGNISTVSKRWSLKLITFLCLYNRSKHKKCQSSKGNTVLNKYYHFRTYLKATSKLEVFGWTLGDCAANFCGFCWLEHVAQVYRRQFSSSVLITDWVGRLNSLSHRLHCRDGCPRKHQGKCRSKGGILGLQKLLGNKPGHGQIGEGFWWRKTQTQWSQVSLVII